ncbi:MAG TPA: PaaI family thioesterase [Candidatus Angelobacter sp.]|nr:PaaI family thioesterase [Candidatus Angelobacter sp.]
MANEPLTNNNDAAGSAAQPAKGHHHRETKNHCFACGKDNPEGMFLDFHFEGSEAVCNFTLTRRYTGPPGHAHGGIIATILDEAMGKVNKLRSVLALTKEMSIEYLKPVPLEKPLVVVAREREIEGRKHVNVGEIKNAAGQVLARGTATFIAIDPEKMFGRFAEEVMSPPGNGQAS